MIVQRIFRRVACHDGQNGDRAQTIDMRKPLHYRAVALEGAHTERTAFRLVCKKDESEAPAAELRHARFTMLSTGEPQTLSARAQRKAANDVIMTGVAGAPAAGKRSYR